MKTHSESTTKGPLAKIKNALKSKLHEIGEKMEADILSNPSLSEKIVFGPIPSRRLGASLGINNVKCKVCTYNCIYCQGGETSCCTMQRECCVSPHELYFMVKRKIQELEAQKTHIDYITFVTSGEPTLDNNLAQIISLVREFGYKIAVITNGSLLWNRYVRESLMYADYVSVKIDTVDEAVWRKINRPHPRMNLDTILQGVSDFSHSFKGILATETMLVKGINDSLEDLGATVAFIKTLRRNTSYFATPIRPPQEKYALSPDKEQLELIKLFVEKELTQTEMICCNETGDFNTSGDFEDDFMGILSVHPMREEATKKFFEENHVEWKCLEEFISQGKIVEIDHLNQKFYKKNQNN